MNHARELLKPGGSFVNTHDVVYNDPVRPQLMIDCHSEAGIPLSLTDQEALVVGRMSEYVPFPKALLENPTQAMVCYNIGTTDRSYTGHWSTLYTEAFKAS